MRQNLELYDPIMEKIANTKQKSNVLPELTKIGSLSCVGVMTFTSGIFMSVYINQVVFMDSLLNDWLYF